MLTEKEFQQAAANGRALAVKCERCGRREVGVLEFCRACGSGELKIVELPATGRIVTYTVQMVAPEPVHGDAPHAVAVVEFEDGTKAMGRLERGPSQTSMPEIGRQVRVAPSSKGGLAFTLEG
ncbi:MAG: Zn-ribbon domain-containing OB-fold protein [Candidatus Bathyarchaeia archaeon]